MMFQVNDSPFVGKDGKLVTSRQIKERLDQELIHNVALRVEETDTPDKFRVSGRGELHLSILLETMRREGFELAVARPEVIVKEVDGVEQEPYEHLNIDVASDYQGKAMELIGARGGDLKNMEPDSTGRVRLEYVIPARGLIGMQSEFLTLTSGTGIAHHVFDHYGPKKNLELAKRRNGVLISNTVGKVSGFALFNLQERGKMLLGPQAEVYEGMVVGIHARDNDLVVNVTKEKQLSNVRASGKDDAIVLTPPINFSLEQALEFIDDDELVELTPNIIRVRKKFLKEHERKRSNK